MKKILLSLLAITSVSGFSQSIPNGSFESWQVSNFDNPRFYQSSNTEDHGGKGSPINTLKTTDAYHGSYAIQLNTVLNNNDTAFAYFANGNPGSNPPSGGVPYSQSPTGLRLYYKSNIIGSDTALVLVFFKKSGSIIGNYMYKISSTKTSYTLLNKTFSPALSQTPDTVIFAAASSNAFLNRGNPGNMLQLDSISFTGVSTQPSNFNGDLELWDNLSNYKLNGWSVGGVFQRTTDFYNGSYALELQTGTPGFGDNQLRLGFASSGIPGQNTTIGGYPYSQQIDTLFFHYKYIPADINDSANINLNFKKNGTFFSGYNKLLELSASYKQVKIPINLSQVPDSMIIFLNSSKTWSVPASYVGSDFKIDNMYLKSQMLPVSDFSLPTSGCVGQSIQLTDQSANMANAWNWIMGGGSPSSSTSQNPVVTYNSVGTKTISMIANNQFGSGSLISHTITIYGIPSVSSTNTTVCSGVQATLTANGANTYTWNTGAQSPTIVVSPTITTNYTVTGATNGCSGISISTVNIPVVTTPSICMVTTDSASVYNMIYWDKTPYHHIDSVIIYREVSTGVYARIGGQKYGALSQFKDSIQTIGPANGNPNVGTYRYKIQLKDSCGQLSQMSGYHNSIYFINNSGSFTWNTYDVEGLTTPVTQFDLMRDDNSTGNWHSIGTVAGTQNVLNDPQYNTYQTTASWRVEASGLNCTPTAKVNAATVSKSKSNVKNNLSVPTDIKSADLGKYISFSPNPAKDELYIKSSIELNKIEIYNLLGEMVLEIQQTKSLNRINISTLEIGIYMIHIETPNGVLNQRIVKE